MLKKRVYRVLSLLLVMVTLMMSISTTALAHYDEAYWNEGKKGQDFSRWMSAIPDNERLSQLSLPGSHDSMAWRAEHGDAARTQTMSLYDQLSSGIRVIDIRLKHNGDTFDCHHGFIYLGMGFEDVLRDVQRFLRNNPTEVVYMRLKQEDSSKSDAEMERLFLTYYNRYKDMFYKGGSQNPTVGESRGKLVLLSDVLSLNGYGINYRNLNKQDNYHLTTNWDLYRKWEDVKNHLNRAMEGSSDTIYMNYLSGSGGSMPYFVASGHFDSGTKTHRLATGLTEPGFHSSYPDFPRVDWFIWFATICFEGTNTLTADYLDKMGRERVGIIMADFPGSRLIKNIIARNGRIGGALEGAVVLYSDAGYKGDRRTFSTGNYDIYSLGAVGNDRASSIMIPPGYRVKLYEHANFKGRSITLSGSCNSLYDYDFNDIVSSIVIERK